MSRQSAISVAMEQLYRLDDFQARKAAVASIPGQLDRLIAAAEWVLEANGDIVVGKDGRQLVTINKISAYHALVAAIKFAKGANE